MWLRMKRLYSVYAIFGVDSDQNISLEVIENLARTMWLRMKRLYSVYAIFGVVTSSTM
jgi:hypothetical protein